MSSGLEEQFLAALTSHIGCCFSKIIARGSGRGVLEEASLSLFLCAMGCDVKIQAGLQCYDQGSQDARV